MDTKRCAECGESASPEATFCQFCGSRIPAPPEPSVPGPPSSDPQAPAHSRPVLWTIVSIVVGAVVVAWIAGSATGTGGRGGAANVQALIESQRAELNENRDAIRDEIQEALDAGDYPRARTTMARFARVGDTMIHRFEGVVQPYLDSVAAVREAGRVEWHEASGVRAVAWPVSRSADPLSDRVYHTAKSDAVAPVTRMSSPYASTRAWVAVGCDASSSWAYFGFTSKPNLTNDVPQSGNYSRVPARIRWDDRIERVSLTQDWGEEFIHFPNDAAAIANLRAHSELRLELEWYGEGQVVFRFPLEGSSAGIDEALRRCGR